MPSRTWRIRDATGEIVAIHERIDEADGGKRFIWKQPDGSPGLGGRSVTELPLYGGDRLPDDELVVLTEGEKAADAVFSAGLASAGTVTGAHTAPNADPLSVLAGHPVVLWPDADAVGIAHMERVGLKLFDIGVSDLRMVALETTESGLDAADCTSEQIKALVASASVWRPPDAFLRTDDDAAFPDPPGEAAFFGLAGDIVRSVALLTEADPAGLLALLLTCFGALAGHWRTFYQGTHQAANIYVLLVGDSSVGRKGTAWSVVRDIFAAAHPGWEGLLVPGLGSGEALIEHLRPPDEPKPGAAPHEHRALILESEYNRLLTVMSRQGNSLSPVLRDAWDGQPIGRFLARQRSLVQWHHVGLIGMITPAELRKVLSSVDQANGFANRHLHIAVKAQRWLPFPESPRQAVTPYLPALRAALAEAQKPGELRWSIDGAMAWEAFYLHLREHREPGLLGAMLARAEAQVARLALIFALLDRAHEIDAVHLDAALALWDYVKRSTAYAYGRSTGDRNADALLSELKRAGAIDMNTVRQVTGLRTAAERDEVVQLLVDLGLVKKTVLKSVGRPKTMIAPATK